MIDTFYHWLQRTANWRRVVFLSAGCVTCAILFAWRERVLSQSARFDGGVLPDGRLWYTPAEVARYFDAIGQEGRQLYAETQLTLDIIFPALYACLLCFAITLICRPAFARYWVWLPVAAGVLDVGENVLLAYLAWTGGVVAGGLAGVAACFTFAKWTLAAVSLIGLLVGLTRRMVAKSPPARD
jgi:hypothetical protein